MLGNINHSASQIPYLMNSGVTHYIEMKDLNLFLQMHFNKVKHIHSSKTASSYFNYRQSDWTFEQWRLHGNAV